MSSPIYDLLLLERNLPELINVDFLVFLFAHFLLLKKSAKLDEVVLNQDVLFPELLLLQPIPLFLPRATGVSGRERALTCGITPFGLRRPSAPHT